MKHLLFALLSLTTACGEFHKMEKHGSGNVTAKCPCCEGCPDCSDCPADSPCNNKTDGQPGNNNGGGHSGGGGGGCSGGSCRPFCTTE